MYYPAFAAQRLRSNPAVGRDGFAAEAGQTWYGVGRAGVKPSASPWKASRALALNRNNPFS